MSDPNVTPTQIRAPKGSDAMEIDWADGHVGQYPNDWLRGYCPCAHCQGHRGTIRFVPDQSSELIEIEAVGNYAISLTWGDGHATGIYSFRFLRSLCKCASCVPPDEAAARPERSRA